MDKHFFDMAADLSPKFNPDIVRGLAVREMRNIVRFVENTTIKPASKSFPAELQYVRCRRCSPDEEIKMIFRQQSGNNARRPTLEIARSDMFLVAFEFTFQGEALDPVYVYMPFVQPGGILRLRGSLFQISPVLADRSISIMGTNKIFLPLNIDRLNFSRLNHNFYRDGQRDSDYVVWSTIWHFSEKDRQLRSRNSVTGKTTLAHYLFAKFGLTRTFAEFANAEVKVGYEDTINTERYPADTWTICESMKTRPQRSVKDRRYVGSSVRLAIPKKSYSPLAKALIAGFFYVVDHFPDRIQPDYIDDQLLWEVLLGLLLFPETRSEGRIAADIKKHFDSLDNYLDDEARMALNHDGINCNDIYDVFVDLIESYTRRVTQCGQHVPSMYNKQLMVLRYVTKDFNNAFNRFKFKVKEMSINPKRQMTKRDVVAALRLHIKPNLMLRISGAKHGEVESVSYPGDNMLVKVTNRIVLQTDSNGTRSSQSTNDPSKILHSSLAEVGSINTMSKSEPSGRTKINPMAVTSRDGQIMRNPELLDVLEDVQRKIQR